MKRTWSFVLIALLIMVMLAGCGRSKRQDPSQKATDTAPAAAQTNVPAEPAANLEATEPPEPAVTPELTEAQQPSSTPESVETAPAAAAEADLSIESRQAGMDKLKSYRVLWQSQWTPADGSETTGWEWREEYSSDPRALHWSWTSSSTNSSGGGGMEIWQIGNTAYMVTEGSDGTTSCISVSSEEASDRLSKGLFSPSLLGSLSGAKFAGYETVNGIATRRYTYDEHAITLIGSGKVSGQAWVATDGGYIVKDAVNWEGGAGLAGLFGQSSDAKGKGSWTWELTDVNQPIEIVPPEDCGGAAGDLPILPDATEKNRIGDIVTYKTASAQADTVEFYKREMAASGWTLAGEPTVAGGLATLQFTKDRQKAQVMITSGGGTTTVLITVTRG
jgi:hypothetical protein